MARVEGASVQTHLSRTLSKTSSVLLPPSIDEQFDEPPTYTRAEVQCTLGEHFLLGESRSGSNLHR